MVKHQPSKLARWVRFPSPAFVRHGAKNRGGTRDDGGGGRGYQDIRVLDYQEKTEARERKTEDGGLAESVVLIGLG